MPRSPIDYTIFVAIRGKNYDVVRSIAQSNPAALTCKDERTNNTPLLYAVTKDDEECVDLLIELGVSVDPNDEENANLMAYVIANGSLRMIEKFYRLGFTSTEYVSHGYRCPLSAQAVTRAWTYEEFMFLYNLGIIEVSFEGKNHYAYWQICLLHAAVMFSSSGTVRALLELNSALALMKSMSGTLPIHHAAQQGSFEMVKLLQHACPSTIDVFADNGNTPIHEAVVSGERAVVRLLHTLGSDSYHIPPLSDDEILKLHNASQYALYRTLMFARSLTEILMLCH